MLFRRIKWRFWEYVRAHNSENIIFNQSNDFIIPTIWKSLTLGVDKDAGGDDVDDDEDIDDINDQDNG